MTKRQYYIDDTQWWYGVHGKYDYIQIALTLVKARATGVCKMKKYGESNMPEVICFNSDDLGKVAQAFGEKFGSDYAFSKREVWW
jgi:hypothetical protein